LGRIDQLGCALVLAVFIVESSNEPRRGFSVLPTLNQAGFFIRSSRLEGGDPVRKRILSRERGEPIPTLFPRSLELVRRQIVGGIFEAIVEKGVIAESTAQIRRIRLHE